MATLFDVLNKIADARDELSGAVLDPVVHKRVRIALSFAEAYKKYSVVRLACVRLRKTLIAAEAQAKAIREKEESEFGEIQRLFGIEDNVENSDVIVSRLANQIRQVFLEGMSFNLFDRMVAEYRVDECRQSIFQIIEDMYVPPWECDNGSYDVEAESAEYLTYRQNECSMPANWFLAASSYQTDILARFGADALCSLNDYRYVDDTAFSVLEAYFYAVYNYYRIVGKVLPVIEWTKVKLLKLLEEFNIVLNGWALVRISYFGSRFWSSNRGGRYNDEDRLVEQDCVVW